MKLYNKKSIVYSIVKDRDKHRQQYYGNYNDLIPYSTWKYTILEKYPQIKYITMDDNLNYIFTFDDDSIIKIKFWIENENNQY